MKIGDWDESIHTDFEQVKRIEAGLKLKPESVVGFDEENKEMLYQGSDPEPYHTTLFTCTCIDRAFRRMPCKHIYFLANVFGLITDRPVFKKKKSSFDKDAEIARYRELYENGDIPADAYVKICNAITKIKK